MSLFPRPYLLGLGVVVILSFFSCKESNTGNKSSFNVPDSVETKHFLVGNDNMIMIPSGILNMGGDNDQAEANEFPKHQVLVDSFLIDAHEVTNAQFKSFVESTGYKTVAERPLNWDSLKMALPPGTPTPPKELLQPGALVFKQSDQPIRLENPGQWWEWTVGANWKQPEGPLSNITDKMDHPAVQIAWQDAMAYAKWSNKRLPTEAEWEWAARGGLADNVYPWGQELDEEKPPANYWQGIFPFKNTEQDGFSSTAPVKSFAPNGYGLYDIAGNVWEWCSDWYGEEYYNTPEAVKANAVGPANGFNRSNPNEPHKILRGGSFLCNDSYCSGYRNSRRMGSSTDTGLNHTGFRCVKDY